MNLINRIFLVTAMVSASSGCGNHDNSDLKADLTLIPPVEITDEVTLDIRGGVINGSRDTEASVRILISGNGKKEILHEEPVKLEPGGHLCVRHRMDSHGHEGDNQVILEICRGKDTIRQSEKIRIIPSDTRSTGRIDGAWAGISHWSETEGKLWNEDIRRLDDGMWKEMVRAMHRCGMDIIVIQEVFRNEAYAGKHDITADSYEGKAYYDSALYPGRMEITAKDPIEAIMSEADSLGMHVMPGIGLFAWFDFGPESLKWHKKVAEEIWERYGHHDSFYGFYISEESGGSLDNWEATDELRKMRKEEILTFFREFKDFSSSLAPDKPVMLATNSFGINGGLDTYPELLGYLDILCPFGFARMPEGDISGKEAADILQRLCDEAGAHLWFDLEAFLFNEDSSLYPRDIGGIIGDLTMYDNFEKILCYQYPGVFNAPDAKISVGGEKATRLYSEYLDYMMISRNGN